MKLKAYELALWCDAAVHGRRKWFWLAGNVFALLLALLIRLMWLALPLLLLANAVLALYLLHRHHAFGEAYQRKPRPVDALCETVLIDTSLIGHGMRLRAAAQPIDVADGLSLRMGSGALLLGTAMVLTSDEMAPVDRAAVLSAVNALNIKPSRLRIHNPVIRREHAKDVTIVTVRDGMTDRHYYLGTPEDVAQRCASIWEGHTREMTEHDHLRIADTARYIAQGDCQVFAWATALESEKPIFLGMAGLGEEVHLSALQDVATLRAMGLTLMLDAGKQRDADLESLRAMMDLPDHHARADIHLTTDAVSTEVPLGITRKPGDSLVEPVTQLRQRFRTIEDTLRRFSLMLAMPLAVALLAGSALTPALITGILVCAAIIISVDLYAPRLRWPTMLCLCVLALLTRAFMSAQPPALSTMASGIIAVAAAAASVIRLGGEGFRFSFRLRNPAFWLMAAAALLMTVLAIYGLFEGFAALLPLGFALLISAVIFMLIIFEGKMLK